MKQFHSIFENVGLERESIIHNLHCFEFSLDQVRVRNDGMHPCQTKASVIHQHLRNLSRKQEMIRNYKSEVRNLIT